MITGVKNNMPYDDEVDQIHLWDGGACVLCGIKQNDDGDEQHDYLGSWHTPVWGQTRISNGSSPAAPDWVLVTCYICGKEKGVEA